MKLVSNAPIGTAWLLCRLAALYILFSVLKHILPLRVLAQCAWRSAAPLSSRETQRYASAAWRVSHWFRISDSGCLQRSLLLYRVLSRAGADPVLVIGFCRGDNGVLGHASVLLEGKPLYESADADPPFRPALRFGSRGRFLA